ncbi:MAG: hypothetical protein UU64_C0001G0063 [candidate division WWE3 bacterium GW2011_GWF2_41_45]|uniref:Uncharacterized protein n=3 Tax=Katanobacteria TaxID=422282 RepID=A0A1F4W3Z4_UNCKA|nr:MAG: hypothetical protein UU55_C0002G0026 [candidate division WWE3 bacterium GW2011_GWC2_41_23]KKS10794.1 MAG: hypothetical protein UU64_C0001G0063 [candidate division WWE3 bacterium GW2011_GWF2_41_45]KKS12470.1 MAG: hypothetical protein UU68_C0001G0062 [candidate division WWE3 bacterium GW2011_GWF1_41_53]KKS20151.1 MAG: hypothetical protein UU79_C0003G0024 [candidate division WWE3 bacterium GW2011_GWE1_41_72]KKS28482.1 MAG: hypothetical protein UU86_C0001G0002 [candidate division WWE3 bacte
MLYRLGNLGKGTVAYASPKALVCHTGRLYINFNVKVTLGYDSVGDRTMRVTMLGKGVLVTLCTIPKGFNIPVLDRWVILGTNFRPVKLEKIVRTNCN